MVKIEITILESANGVKFGSDPSEVHKVFGNSFKNYKNKKLTTSDNDFLLNVAERMAKISGRPVTDYTKYLKEETEFDYDPCDYYFFCMIDYDANEHFNAISVYANHKTTLIVNGKDCSDFNISTLKSFADDFIWDSLTTSWTSYSKQISLFCPENQDIIELVLFGCPEYYQNENK